MQEQTLRRTSKLSNCNEKEKTKQRVQRYILQSLSILKHVLLYYWKLWCPCSKGKVYKSKSFGKKNDFFCTVFSMKSVNNFFNEINKQLSCILTSLTVAASSFSPPPHPDCGTLPPVIQKRVKIKMVELPAVASLFDSGVWSMGPYAHSVRDLVVI